MKRILKRNIKLIIIILIVSILIIFINIQKSKGYKRQVDEINLERFSDEYEAYLETEQEIEFDEIEAISLEENKEYVSTFKEETTLNVNQEAIQEVADAYYNKSIYAQYCSFRKSFLYSPEEATSQHTIYSVCSDFTYSVYYQAFGIQIPDLTAKIAAYGQKYYDADNITTNDVVEFWEQTTDDDGNKVFCDNNGNKKDIDLSTASGRSEYAQVLLTEYDLQIGDVVCYRSSDNSNGHAVMVYDIIYDNEGNPTDAIIRESTSNYERKTTKITKGLSYCAKENESTGITEGTFREYRLSSALKISDTSTRNSLIYSMRNSSYMTILRPLLRDESGNYTGRYYYALDSSDSSATFGYTYTERTLTDYEITDSTLSRIEYSKMDIDKTVNVFNNSVVELGDTITYTIKVTNNSESTYGGFNIVENISDYVDVMDSSNGTVNDDKITWTISGLEAGETKEIKYSVKVKNDINILGKQINSTGTVAGIPSATVNNTISSNLNSDEIKEIATRTEDTISSNHTGENFIEEIYKNVLNMDLNLENFDITNLVITRAGTQYYPDESSFKPTVYINEDDEFYNMVLKDYWGALYTNSSNTVYLKYWENTNSKISGRSERADTIYKENFQTGDILVYQNTQTASDNVTYETENGTYYLIYLSEENKIIIDEDDFYGFVGLDDDGEIKQISTNYDDLQTLLGKDYYAILRPAMVYTKEIEKQISKVEVTTLPTKISYIQNYEELDLTGGILTVTYNDGTTDTISLTNENITVTGFDNSKIGKITITAEYEEHITTFEVEIINNNTNSEDNNNIDNNTINDTNTIENNTNKVEDENDNTIANGILPKAGVNKVIIIVIIILIVIAAMLLKKQRDLDF